MWIPKEIAKAAEKLHGGGWVRRITVRQLLHIFGSERRGMNKVQEIRTALDYLGLETEPDFESAWIDSLIHIRLKPDEAISAVIEPQVIKMEPSEPIELEPDEPIELEPEEPIEIEDQPIELEDLVEMEPEDEQQHPAAAHTKAIPSMNQTESTASMPHSSEGVVETAVSEKTQAGPTFRIGNFEAANRGIISVGPDDPLCTAVTKMLLNDFSQLPIMQGERDVKGAISWRSIGARKAMGGNCEGVKDAREDAQVIDANGTLFDAIPTIVKHGYVLVRDQRTRKITGIVTASDLSLQFQQLAEPFILLREIELHIRRLLQGKITLSDVEGVVTPEDGRTPNSISDLTFGEYVRLFQHPDIWGKLALQIDKSCLTAQLEEVRVIRNDVMHFDPDPMTSKDLETLKGTAKFMQQLFELLPN